MYRPKVYKQQFTVWLTFFSFKCSYHNFFGYDLVRAELSRARTEAPWVRKIWFTYWHSTTYVRTYVHPPLHVSQGEILHFEDSDDVSLMSTLTWITEKELELEIKTKETNFVGRKTWKFIAAVRKWEMLAATKVKCRSEKKVNRNTYNDFLHKTCNHRRPRRNVCQYINIHMDKMGWVVETPMN